jgi:hypothetical protein
MLNHTAVDNAPAVKLNRTSPETVIARIDALPRRSVAATLSDRKNPGAVASGARQTSLRVDSGHFRERQTAATQVPMRHPYPDQIDCLWIASDRDGHAAAFVTAGSGPIPRAVLDRDAPPLDDLEALVCELPIRSDATMLVDVPRPDDFVAMAARGLFVYDWRDVHRTSSSVLDAYEPVAYPQRPVHVTELPPQLASACTGVVFADLAFSSGGTLRPQDFVDVARPPTI